MLDDKAKLAPSPSASLSSNTSNGLIKTQSSKSVSTSSKSVFLTEILFDKLARSQQLNFGEAEKNEILKQINDTLEFIKNLKDIKTEGVEPTSQVTGLETVTREDVVKPSLSQEETLKNAKSTYNGFFKVEGILNNE